MRPRKYKGLPVSRQYLRKTLLYLLTSGALSLTALTGCATVDSTFDRVKSGVSNTFSKEEKPENDALPVTGQPPTPEQKAPTKKPLLVEIQEKLRTLGYYSGPISGKLDSRSEAAIQDFQLDQDLRINGRVSQSLLKEINKALELVE